MIIGFPQQGCASPKRSLLPLTIALGLLAVALAFNVYLDDRLIERQRLQIRSQAERLFIYAVDGCITQPKRQQTTRR